MTRFHDFKFSGRGQRYTPVTTVDNAVEIIMLLPGKRARQYRQTAIRALLDVMNPTDEFVDQITNRLELQKAEAAKPQNLLVNRDDKITSLAPRAYNDTHGYIRIRYPDEYIQNADNRKALTLDIIKFGIAYNLNDRHRQYSRDEPDNGFMVVRYPWLLFMLLTSLSQRVYIRVQNSDT